MKIMHVNCGLRIEYESDLRSNQHNLRGSEIRAWKKSGPSGIWTHDLCDTGAVVYHLSSQTDWERVVLSVRNKPGREVMN